MNSENRIRESPLQVKQNTQNDHKQLKLKKCKNKPK